LPCVTTLRPGRAARYVVHLDGAYLGTLSEMLVARYGLYAGCELSDANAEALRADADREAALACAYRLLSQRSRGIREMRQRLAAKGYPENVTSAIVDRLTAEGLLDDAAFAAAYVADKRRLSGWGNQRLAAGLRRLGVDPAVVDEAIASPDEEAQDEAGRAAGVLARMGRPTVPFDTARRRAFDRLRRRGFSTEVAQHAVRAWLAEAADVSATDQDDTASGPS